MAFVHIILYKDGYVVVELKVTGPIAYPLTQTSSVAYEHNQLCVYFILKLLTISETFVC